MNGGLLGATGLGATGLRITDQINQTSSDNWYSWDAWYNKVSSLRTIDTNIVLNSNYKMIRKRNYLKYN